MLTNLQIRQSDKGGIVCICWILWIRFYASIFMSNLNTIVSTSYPYYFILFLIWAWFGLLYLCQDLDWHFLLDPNVYNNASMQALEAHFQSRRWSSLSTQTQRSWAFHGLLAVLSQWNNITLSKLWPSHPLSFHSHFMLKGDLWSNKLNPTFLFLKYVYLLESPIPLFTA